MNNQFDPLLTDFILNDTWTINLTIDQFYDEFLADSAPSLWTEFWRQIPGSHSIEQTQWLDNDIQFKNEQNPQDYMMSNGIKALKVRRLKAKLPVTGVPMCNEAHVSKTLSLIIKSNSKLKLKIVQRSSGTPYCDSNQVEEMWDFVGEGESISARQSFKIHFFYRPMFVAGTMETRITEAQIDAVKKWRVWSNQQVQAKHLQMKKEQELLEQRLLLERQLQKEQESQMQYETLEQQKQQQQEQTLVQELHIDTMVQQQTQSIPQVIPQLVVVNEVRAVLQKQNQLSSTNTSFFSADEDAQFHDAVEEKVVAVDQQKVQSDTQDVQVKDVIKSENLCMDFTNAFKKKRTGNKQPKKTLEAEQDQLDDVNKDLEDLNLGQQQVDLPIPRNLKITAKQMAQRKVLDQRRWHCLARPQYPKSCGISSLTSCWNYLFSTLGTGKLPPISTEEALEVIGFKPPYTDVQFGSFTGNDTLIQWFGLLNKFYRVSGEARICFKLHGNSVTHGIDSAQALVNLKQGLKDESKAFIYHCYNHYMCPIGYEENPTKPNEAYSCKTEISEYDDWIIIGEISKMYPCFHIKRWSDIAMDINCQFPNFYNIRKAEQGIQTKTTKSFIEGGKSFGGNLHCLIQFERTKVQVPEISNKDYLKKELSQVLVEALQACAIQRPANPTLFVSEFLKNHS